MSTILITGGTGLIGQALSKALLEKGDDVIILSRNPGKTRSGVRYARWNIKNGTLDQAALAEADHIIHLAGASLADKRWTPSRKKEIVESRARSAALLTESLKKYPNKLKSLLSASGIGWYGEDAMVPNPSPFTENDPHDKGFLGTTCFTWESGIEPVRSQGKRLVIFRIGPVLDENGGMIVELRLPMRFGIAPILGSGKQVVSWIHIDDLVRMIIHALSKSEMDGIFNAVAPHPVTNRHLTLQLAKNTSGAFHIPFSVPPFMLHILRGEMSVEVLKSTTVSAEKIMQTGFRFLYPTIEQAMESFKKK